MPYISADDSRKVKKALCEALPEYRFSVHRENGSMLHVHIVGGPLPELDGKIESANQYWVDRDFADRPRVAEMLRSALLTISTVAPIKTLYEDGDYGSIPNYYLSLEIGKWPKPFQSTTGVTQ